MGWGCWGVVARLGGHRASLCLREGPVDPERTAALTRAVVVEDVHEVPPGLQCDF